MARQPQPAKPGAERDHHQHSGPDTEYSDTGEQAKAQNPRGGATPVAKDDPHEAPESGDKPDAARPGDARR